MAETIASDLRRGGCETQVAESGVRALELLGRELFDVVVTALRMKSVDGLDLLDAVKRAAATVPVIIMTAFGGIASAVEAMRRGAYYYVTKPFELDVLRGLVERACRERPLARENALLRRSLHENAASQRRVGQSEPMRELRALIERVSAASSPVVISGEAGTGKELVALAIHA